jgi:hypothetical protein
MPNGLSVSRLIALSLSLSSAGAQYANFNSLLVLGESNVIDVGTRIMSFNSLEDVAAVFGTTDPEYLAAEAYFGQTPQPTQLYIGRWAQTATAGILFCGALTPTEQAMGLWTTHTAAEFNIQVDAAGAPVLVTCGTMAGAGNLNAVATIINAAMVTADVGATCVWTGSAFVFTSSTTGVNSKVKPLTAGGAQDISAQLAGTLATGAREVDGIAAESALTAVTILDSLSTQWFGLNDDACPNIADADHEAIAAYIEAAAHPHLYGFTSGEAGVLVSSTSTDIGSVLQAGGYQQIFVCWSQTAPYQACGYFGRLLTTNFAGNNTTITLAYKTVAAMTPDALTDSQAAVLDSKGYNYFATYNNGVAIITNGCCICSSIVQQGEGANEVFIDEIYGALALASQMQTNYFDLLASLNKLPQTDAGNHLGANAIEAALTSFVGNGYLGPGTWNGGGFGQLATGQFLPKGYYVYTPLIASQAQAPRQARQSVPYQVAGKTAGATQSANISFTVNP